MTSHAKPRGTGRATLVLLAWALLASCNMPQAETPVPIPEPIPSPTPQPCSLVAPGIPASETRIHETLRPSLGWLYDGACAPDGFRVQVSPGGDFDAPGALTATTAPANLSWTPDQDLAPATSYAWRVAALAGDVPGPWSVTDYFWTGPTCDGSNLQAPTLIAPTDGVLIGDPSPVFEWDYPQDGCLQAHYALEASASPDFAIDALYAGVGPERSYETDVPFLEDCTQYYWRVKAVYGEDISGPYSAISTFFADLAASCGAHGGMPGISGVIWADFCPATGSPSPGAPPGCVWQEGGLAPDGIQQDSEEAIAGLLVRIAPGVCTAPGIGWTTGPTDETGYYKHFVTPGTYCVWVYRDRDGNQATLGRGRWTHPPGGYDSPVRYEIEVDWGEERADLDFGWVHLP